MWFNHRSFTTYVYSQFQSTSINCRLWSAVVPNPKTSNFCLHECINSIYHQTAQNTEWYKRQKELCRQCSETNQNIKRCVVSLRLTKGSRNVALLSTISALVQQTFSYSFEITGLPDHSAQQKIVQDWYGKGGFYELGTWGTLTTIEVKVI